MTKPDTSTQRALTFAGRLPAFALVGLIRLYQRTLSPALPVISAGACGCRFSPTCSHYAVEAIRAHGAWAGMWLTLRRLVKCTPLHPGGIDPVPFPTNLGPRPIHSTIRLRTRAPICTRLPG